MVSPVHGELARLTIGRNVRAMSVGVAARQLWESRPVCRVIGGSNAGEVSGGYWPPRSEGGDLAFFGSGSSAVFIIDGLSENAKVAPTNPVGFGFGLAGTPTTPGRWTFVLELGAA